MLPSKSGAPESWLAFVSILSVTDTVSGVAHGGLWASPQPRTLEKTTVVTVESILHFAGSPLVAARMADCVSRSRQYRASQRQSYP